MLPLANTENPDASGFTMFAKTKTIFRERNTIVEEQKYFSLSLPIIEPGSLPRIYRQTIYHVAVKAGFYHRAVEVY